MIVLQKRDIEYLKMLARFGVLSRTTVNKIYGGHTDYPKRRRKKLEDGGYIIRNNKNSCLSSEGKEYVRKLGIEPRNISGDKRARDRIAKIAEILIPLESTYKIYPSWEIKKDLPEMKLLYYGKIVNLISSSEYFIYNIGKLNSEIKAAVQLKRRFIYRIRDEIFQSAKSNKFNRVIVFAENGLAMNAYKEELKPLGVKEQLLLPLTDYGINLLKLYSQRDINYMAARLVYGAELVKADWVYADYALNDGTNIMVLINNDMEKLIRIKQYLELFKYNNSSKKSEIELLCLENQKESLEREIPGIPIRTVKLEELTKRAESS